MMTAYFLEALRNTAEAHYRIFYRNRAQVGATNLDAMNDMLLSGARTPEDYALAQSILDDEWYRRWIYGVSNKSTGIVEFTQPRPRRMALIVSGITCQALLTAIETMAPRSLDAAPEVRRSIRLSHLADQRLLASVIRGNYLGAVHRRRHSLQRIATVCFLPGERHFRMRVIDFHYVAEGSETEADTRARLNRLEWDEISFREGLAAFGVRTGIAHISNENDTYSFELRDLNIHKRRCFGFSMDSELGPVDMRLVDTVDDLQRANFLLNDASAVFCADDPANRLPAICAPEPSQNGDRPGTSYPNTRPAA